MKLKSIIEMLEEQKENGFVSIRYKRDFGSSLKHYFNNHLFYGMVSNFVDNIDEKDFNIENKNIYFDLKNILNFSSIDDINTIVDYFNKLKEILLNFTGDRGGFYKIVYLISPDQDKNIYKVKNIGISFKVLENYEYKGSMLLNISNKLTYEIKENGSLYKFLKSFFPDVLNVDCAKEVETVYEIPIHSSVILTDDEENCFINKFLNN